MIRQIIRPVFSDVTRFQRVIHSSTPADKKYSQLISNIRREFVTMFGNQTPIKYIEQLNSIARSDNNYNPLRHAAVVSMGVYAQILLGTNNPQATNLGALTTNLLCELLSNEKSTIMRESIMLYLGKLRNPLAIPYLHSALRTESNLHLIDVSAWALSRIADPTAYHALYLGQIRPRILFSKKARILVADSMKRWKEHHGDRLRDKRRIVLSS